MLKMYVSIQVDPGDTRQIHGREIPWSHIPLREVSGALVSTQRNTCVNPVLNPPLGKPLTATVVKKIWDVVWLSMAVPIFLLSKSHIFIMLFLRASENPPPAEPWEKGLKLCLTNSEICKVVQMHGVISSYPCSTASGLSLTITSYYSRS